MCPGGQIVPTSVNPEELCVNGMSFSKRESRWANSALVVQVNPDDIEGNDILRGVKWQQEIEQKAAKYGGGNLVCPVQRVTDFLSESVKDMDQPTLSSSYRLGVKYAPNHEIYPPFVTQALQSALQKFDKLMPGFITHDAILHGVETRTSAPVQIKRDPNTLQCLTVSGLFPAGEGITIIITITFIFPISVTIVTTMMKKGYSLTIRSKSRVMLTIMLHQSSLDV